MNKYNDIYLAKSLAVFAGFILNFNIASAFINFKSSPIDKLGEEAQYICPTAPEGAFAMRLVSETDTKVWSVNYKWVQEKDESVHYVSQTGTDMFVQGFEESSTDEDGQTKKFITVGVGLSKGDFKGDPVYHQFNVTDLKMSIFAKDGENIEYILKNIDCIKFEDVTVVPD